MNSVSGQKITSPSMKLISLMEGDTKVATKKLFKRSNNQERVELKKRNINQEKIKDLAFLKGQKFLKSCKSTGNILE